MIRQGKRTYQQIEKDRRAHIHNEEMRTVKGASLDKLSVNQSRCKGCYYCVKACPKQVIRICNKKNEKGYQPVEIDQENCTSCGCCFEVCPDMVFEIL